MNDMKCPFCGEKLQQTFSFNPKQFWCSNYYDHKHPINLQGTKELWQELIRTRKALGIAVGKLKGTKAFYDDSYADPHTFVNWHTVAQRLANDADDAIKEITALEQKE